MKLNLKFESGTKAELTFRDGYVRINATTSKGEKLKEMMVDTISRTKGGKLDHSYSDEQGKLGALDVSEHAGKIDDFINKSGRKKREEKEIRKQQRKEQAKSQEEEFFQNLKTTDKKGEYLLSSGKGKEWRPKGSLTRRVYFNEDITRQIIKEVGAREKDYGQQLYYDHSKKKWDSKHIGTGTLKKINEYLSP